jgi:adenylate cyclase
MKFFPTKPASRRALIVVAICAAFTALLAVLWDKGFVPLQEIEFFAQDWQTRLGRKTPLDNRLVLIGIDKPVYLSGFSDEEIQREPVLRDLQQNFPWSREVWAKLIQKLCDAGAKVVVVDLVFQSPGEGDEQLKQALEKYKDRVVIGYGINDSETRRGNFRDVSFPSETVIEPRGTNSAFDDDRLGYVTIWPDFDGTLRRASFRSSGADLGDIASPDTILESMDARVLRKFGAPEKIPSGLNPRMFRYTAPPGEGFKPEPIGDVLSPKYWERNYKNGEFFKDKIVLIGPTAEIFHDEHDTPFAFPKKQMAGPEIHLNIINAALHGEFLNEPSLAAQLLIITIAGIFAVALCFLFPQPLKRFVAIILLSAIYIYAAHHVFEKAGIGFNILVTAIPLIVLIGSGIVTLAYDYFLERREKKRVRKTLERYVSRDVVKELLDNPQTFFNSLGGVRKPVTILFSDVRGFTTLTESADSAALVKQLNEYFQEMVALVFSHEGSLDKFIGDAVMAVWGNIVSNGAARDAKNAVSTALAMKRSLEKLNADWKSRGMLELHFGIGLNHGEVIVGNLGSSEKMELTVIGDAVNLASRLEGLTKEYHLDLLLGESVAKLVSDQYLLRLVDSVQVKGKTKPVDVYTVMGDGAGQTVSLPLWLARYEEGVRLYRNREFAGAANLFEESLRRQPGDFLTEMYLQRCRALLENPPDESWNGVFVMTKK